MRNRRLWILAIAAVATPVSAQLRLPLSTPGLPLAPLPQTLDQFDAQSIDRLTDLRHLYIRRLIGANRRLIEADPNGEPIVRNEILAMSPDAAAASRALALGFAVMREQTITASLRLLVLKVPDGMSTEKALRVLRAADPTGTYDFNHIYTDGGAVAESPPQGAAGTGGKPSLARIRIGLVDTGVDATHPAFQGSVMRAWGCGERRLPGAHGTAVASLLVRRAPAELYAADVYCGQATGGAVDTIVAALAWMVAEDVPVINVSLVGPKNLLLAEMVGMLVARGFVIVAAVGNDGPAAAPLYPAAYPKVVGVTGVDARRHVLLEAERGPQVMFAARGADLRAADLRHGLTGVRGTSFAAPIVAALLAARLSSPSPQTATAAIDGLVAEAVDLGPPGRDPIYGYGLLGAD